MYRIKKSVTAILLLFIAVLFLINGKETAEGIKKGLSVCGDVIIPSLFPFMVVSSVCNKYDFGRLKINRIISRLFNVPEFAVKIIVFSFIGGFPVGMKMISEAYEAGRITKRQAKRLMSFCVNSGPAFILNVVGNGIFSSKQAGIIILISVISASLITGIIGGIADREKCLCEKYYCNNDFDFSDVLISSVNSSINGIIAICGWVMLFLCLKSTVFSYIYNEKLKMIFSVVGEVTDGAFVSAENGGIPLTSFCVSFGGICVGLQLFPYIRKTGASLRKYFIYRFANGIISYFIAFVIVRLTNQSVMCISSSQGMLSSYAPSSCILLFAFFVMIVTQIKDENEAIDIF